MKLSVVHLVEEGVYLCESAPWGVLLECAGLPVKAPFTFAEASDLSVVRNNPAPLLHWEDGNENFLTPAEYSVKLIELDTRDEEGDWDSLDAEYAFRKFGERWKPVHGQPSVTREPVELEITEVRTNSGHPGIKSLWNATTVPRDRCLYSVSTDNYLVSYLRQQCGVKGLGLEVPSHSGIRYAKIEGKYVFPDNSDHRGRTFMGTLEQCKEHIGKLEELVNDAVTIAFATKTNTLLMNAGQVAEELRAIQHRLYGVTATKASHSALTSVTRDIGALIKNVVNSVRNTNETP